MATTQTSKQYARPPITEAVVAVHFQNAVSFTSIQKYAARQKKEFPRGEIHNDVEITIGPDQKSSAKLTPTGMRLTSADQTRITNVQSKQFAVAHLAPYQDWNFLYRDAMEQYGDFIKAVGRLPLHRLSTRFINRIDIPNPQGKPLQLQEYLTAGVSAPDELKKMHLRSFVVSSTFQDDANEFMHVLNIAPNVPSPLIDHSSFALDIDVYTTKPLPLKETEISTIFDELRLAKNRVFESCITAKTRKLFE